MSQIPEDSGKPFYPDNKKSKQNSKPLMDYGDEDNDKILTKIVIHFQDEGIVISAWDLHTIEKDIQFVEKPKAHWEFGITINKGLTPNQYITKTDLSMWYITEKVRDEKWDKLMNSLKIEGLSVIEIE